MGPLAPLKLAVVEPAMATMSPVWSQWARAVVAVAVPPPLRVRGATPGVGPGTAGGRGGGGGGVGCARRGGGLEALGGERGNERGGPRGALAGLSVRPR